MARPYGRTGGLKADVLTTVLDRLAHDSSNIHSVLVERDGYFVAELYKPGQDRVLAYNYGVFSTTTEFGPDTLHVVRSVSKSVIGLLYGMALDRKQVPLPENTVSESLPRFKGLDSAKAVKIRHLPTMSTGLAWEEIGWAAAIGNGGQRITVIPELNMTVVVTAGDYGSPEIQTTVSKLIDEIIVVALP